MSPQVKKLSDIQPPHTHTQTITHRWYENVSPNHSIMTETRVLSGVD